MARHSLFESSLVQYHWSEFLHVTDELVPVFYHRLLGAISPHGEVRDGTYLFVRLVLVG